MKIYFHKDVPPRVKNLAVKNNWIQFDNSTGPPSDGIVLMLDEGRLAIRDLSEANWNPLCIDFLEPKFLLRLKKVQNETQLIKRAVGFKPQDNILIWDATAGLGRDTMVLIKLGYRVVAVERSAILFELLYDAIERAKQSNELHESLGRLQLLVGDSKILLSQLKEVERPDVIYLDPMYPETKKSSQPKKEMQFLRKLLGPDDNLAKLIETARAVAKKKVILKNSPRANLNLIAKLSPKHSLESKGVRFDIF